MGDARPAEVAEVGAVVTIPAALLARAIETFGTEAKAIRWLTAVHPHRLGGRAPVALWDTDEGRRAVLQTLGRIDHGVVG